MNYTPASCVFGRTWANTVLAAYKTLPSGALVVTPKCRLFTDPTFAPSPDMTIAQLAAIEAAYSGYAAGGVAVVVGAPVNLKPTVQGAMTPITFVATDLDPFVPAVCYGWWLDDGTNVIAAERFSGGLVASFSAPGDFLQLDVTLPFPLTVSGL